MFTDIELRYIAVQLPHIAGINERIREKIKMELKWRKVARRNIRKNNRRLAMEHQ